MRNSLALFAGMALLAQAVSAGAAGFINDRRAWNALTPEGRAGYVQGLNDSLNYIFADDTLAEALAKQGRTRCLTDLKLSAGGIADRMNFLYRDDRYAAAPPTAVYILKMAEICKSYIDRERASFGLGPS